MLLKPQPCTHFLLEIPVPPATHTNTHTHTGQGLQWDVSSEWEQWVFGVRAGVTKREVYYIIFPPPPPLPSPPPKVFVWSNTSSMTISKGIHCYCTHVCSLIDWCEYRDDTFLQAGIGLGHTEMPIKGRGKKAQNDSSTQLTMHHLAG